MTTEELDKLNHLKYVLDDIMNCRATFSRALATETGKSPTAQQFHTAIKIVMYNKPHVIRDASWEKIWMLIASDFEDARAKASMEFEQA